MKYLLYITFIGLTWLSCKDNSPELIDATIFERRSLSTGGLMIFYTFSKNGTVFRDSVEIKKDVVIPGSLKVEYSSENPQKTRIHFPLSVNAGNK